VKLWIGWQKTRCFYPKRTELNPSVRIKTLKSHIILYRIDGETIDVIRIRHGQEDWLSDT